MSKRDPILSSYDLTDRYTKRTGRVFLTGTQALVRIMLDQANRDARAGLNTAGFVSGYRGSPLGAVDMEMWRAKSQFDEAGIKFLPAVNEDLGATAVLGAQKASLDPRCDVQGVFSMWYGKGPGVDRSGDALRHGNAYGSAPKGGVLVVAGDDHGCVSSSMPHQSDVAFMSWFMPTLAPANVAEYLSFGEYGIALSRFSGTWVGFKAVSETVESAQSIRLTPPRAFATPDFTPPPGGLHIRATDLPSPEIETRIGHKLDAVRAFVEANPIDRPVYDLPNARFGFVTTGKAHLDLMEALRLLGLDDAACRTLGIDIYKVGMVWPLARRDALKFVQGKSEVCVIEEKRGIIESQFKEYFYDWPGSKPEKMVGKYDSQGAPLVPWTGELSPRLLLPLIAARLDRVFPDLNLPDKAAKIVKPSPPVLTLKGATRTPYFCSGCPHNSSTKVPTGSKAASGIGCHVMASWMDRDTEGYAQMGGEGVPHVAASMFTGQPHMFQNLGEGTWYHSGALAIRQAVAAGTNITYKILFNDAVAMTGGQPVDGPISVAGIAQTSRAEGVSRIALVSDDIAQFDRAAFPRGTTFHDRSDLMAVQTELREVAGVSVLIYAQPCATETRRRRKRGTQAPAKRHVIINPDVCEGCGDCSAQSNCLSVEPLDTPLGRKRRINQSTCNQDETCLTGFCPSFITIDGPAPRVAAPDLGTLLMDLPEPEVLTLTKPYNLLITGVGGTGVITLGALVTMAAHLEGKGASVLDFTGFAQKFGTVLSYIRLAHRPGDIHQVRIDHGSADAVIGCDVVVSSAPMTTKHYKSETRMVLNTAEMPTGDLVLRRDASLQVDARVTALSDALGPDALSGLNANKLAEQVLGNAVFANMIMLGAAWQRGMVPVSMTALTQAIDMNGVRPAENKQAFAVGRLTQIQPDKVEALLRPAEREPSNPQQIIAHRSDLLRGYQNAAYGERYETILRPFVERVTDPELQSLAAKSLYKLMAYKDEYDVARLHVQGAFANRGSKGPPIRFHMAPPLLAWRKDARGRPVKWEFGPWILPALRVLARARGLRGTWADPFGYSAERREMRELIDWYVQGLSELVDAYHPDIHDAAITFLSAPLDMRGFGPVWQDAVRTYKPAADAALLSIAQHTRQQ